jgi:hypothetical protein
MLYLRPFSAGVHRSKINHFQKRIICRKDAFVFRNLAKRAIEIFNLIGRINQRTYFLRILEIGAQRCKVCFQLCAIFGVFALLFSISSSAYNPLCSFGA